MLSLKFYLFQLPYSKLAKIQKHKILFLSGFFLGLGTHIHPTIAFFLPAYLILQLYNLPRIYFDKQFLRKLKPLFMLLLGFAMPFFIGMLLYSPQTVIVTYFREKSMGDMNYTPLQMFEHIGASLEREENLMFYLLFIGLLVIIIINLLSKTSTGEFQKKLIPLYLILSFINTAALLLTRYYNRLSIPLLALISLILVIYYDLFLTRFVRPHTAQAIILIFAFVTALTSIAKYTKYAVPYRYTRTLQDELDGKQTLYRETYDLLQNQVDTNHKLLITPYLVYAHRKGFTLPVYFGPNAKYISDYTYNGKSLSDLIISEKIAFIFISKVELDTAILDIPLEKKGIDFYGLRLNDWQNGYTLAKELDILYSFLKQQWAQKIFISENGTIYRL